MLTAFVVLYALRTDTILVDKPRFVAVLERVQQLPDIRTDLVLPNVISAFANETPDYPAELLLALAWGESRMDPTIRTRRVCSVLQVVPRSPDDCRGLMNGYTTGVWELKELARDRRTHGELRRVLEYRACGNAAFDGTCTKQRWVNAALARARQLGMRDVRPLS